MNTTLTSATVYALRTDCVSRGEKAEGVRMVRNRGRGPEDIKGRWAVDAAFMYLYILQHIIL
jgi:hypothetical protein